MSAIERGIIPLVEPHGTDPSQKFPQETDEGLGIQVDMTGYALNQENVTHHVIVTRNVLHTGQRYVPYVRMVAEETS